MMTSETLSHDFFRTVGETLPLPPEVQQERAGQAAQAYEAYREHVQEFQVFSDWLRTVVLQVRQLAQPLQKSMEVSYSKPKYEPASQNEVFKRFAAPNNYFSIEADKQYFGDQKYTLSINQTHVSDKNRTGLTRTIELEAGNYVMHRNGLNIDFKPAVETFEQTAAEIAKRFTRQNPELMQTFQDNNQLEPGPLTDHFITALREELPHVWEAKRQKAVEKEAEIGRAYDKYAVETGKFADFANDLAGIIATVNASAGEKECFSYDINCLTSNLAATFPEPAPSSLSISTLDEDHPNVCTITLYHKPNRDKVELSPVLLVTVNDGIKDTFRAVAHTLPGAAEIVAHWMTKTNPALMKQVRDQNVQAQPPALAL
jgi:hypothetical protein